MSKLRGIAAVTAMVMALSVLVAPTASALPDYEPVPGGENWTPAKTTDANNVELTKTITARPTADTWDIDLSVLTPDSKLSARTVQVALVLDVSGSMSANGSTRLANLKTALTQPGTGLLDQIAELGTVHVSVSLFSSSHTGLNPPALPPNGAMVLVGMTSKPLGQDATALSQMRSAINGINRQGNTNVQAGINMGLSTFQADKGEKVMIVMTDGATNSYFPPGGTQEYWENNYTSPGYTPSCETSVNCPKSYAAAVTAATNAKNTGVIIHTVGFDIGGSGPAHNLLQDIKSPAPAGTYAHVPNSGGSAQAVVEALREAFFSVVKISTAMIADPIDSRFEIVGTPKVTVTPTMASVPAPSVINGIIRWSPAGGSLEPKTFVRMTYTVKLKETPAPGTYQNVPTNGTGSMAAQFTYKLSDAMGGAANALDFPQPTVRYATGLLRTMIETVNANGVVVGSRTQLQTSSVVYTDYVPDATGKYQNDLTLNRAADPYAAPVGYAYFFKQTYADVLQPGTTLLNGASATDLVAKPGLTTFTAKIGAGVNTVVYQYRVAGPSNKGMIVEKTASPMVVDKVGTKIDYTIEVVNVTNSTLYNIVIHDQFSVPGVNLNVQCPQGLQAALPAGAHMVCTASYVVTQADADRGEIKNVVWTTSGSYTSDPDEVIVEITAEKTKEITVTKTASPMVIATVGTPITFTIKVANTGAAIMNNVQLHDQFSVPGVDLYPWCGPGLDVLKPGDVVECVASYTVTQADVDRGDIVNAAWATSGTYTSNRDEVTVSITADKTKGMSVTKTASPMVVDTVGTTVNYTITVVNTGAATLTNIVIHDEFSVPGVSLNAQCDPAKLAELKPAEQLVCTASHVVTQADVDRGDLKNSAWATSGNYTSDPDEVIVVITADKTKGLTVTKTASPMVVDTVGVPVNFVVTVKNTGAAILNNVQVHDNFSVPGYNLVLQCGTGNLTVMLPGEQVVCTATYYVTQADADRGEIKNTAWATSGTYTSGTDDVTVEITADKTKGMSVTKTASPMVVNTVGTTVNYTFTIKNTGWAILNNVVIHDEFSVPGVNLTPQCDAAKLAVLRPGEEVVCTASYVVTQADADRGEIKNSAWATSGNYNSDPDEVIIDITAPKTKKLTIVKTADPMVIATVPTTINYTITVTNTGAAILHNVVVQDQFSVPGVTLPLQCETAKLAVLRPGEQAVCTASYVVTQADVDRDDSIVNSAWAITDDDYTSDPDEIEIIITAPKTKRITIVKTADPMVVTKVGTWINYTITATNTGAATLRNVVVHDQFSVPGVELDLQCDTGKLAVLRPGEEIVCTAKYQVTQADADQGEIKNSAWVTTDDDYVADPDEIVVIVDPPKPPEIKTGGSADSSGLMGTAIMLALAAAAALVARRRLLA
jgi:uncharacterized repeat protein (TIGR01451 family)